MGAQLIGQRFHRLTVEAEAGSNVHKKRLWRCRCDCGATKITTTGQLRSGKTGSCGCYWRETSTTHGHANTPTYLAWQAMHGRCRNRGHTAYAYYGGRGISVCERWSGFENFLADMGEMPPGYSLDRIDNEGGYEPGNCRWVTMAEQARNKRNRVEYQHDGIGRSLAEWAEVLGVNQELIRGRLRRGWTFRDAISNRGAGL